MSSTFDLDFCYKGSRNYVHGTDIFSKLTEHFEEDLQKIDLLFHGITVNNLHFVDQQPKEDDVKVLFRVQTAKQTLKYFGIEDARSVECRYPYAEETIVAHSVLGHESISLTTPTTYNFIEHIVAMNKALLENLYPNLDGKWYFTRLQLAHNIDMATVSSLVLTLKANFQFKLTKTALLVNGKAVGFIYFSLKPKGS